MLLTVLIAAGLGQFNSVKVDRSSQEILNRVSEDSLRGNLSFLASDLLEGRATPSRGLDLAAEFIASQFRKAGLEPAGDDGYFQTGVFPTAQGYHEYLKRTATNTGQVYEELAKHKVRNVIGVMRGTDPKLRDSYILVTAHYDHLGYRPGKGIYNGANDDGSGTVSVIELANALKDAKLKRSVVFMTFYGEELGLLGSIYYGAHPVFPVSKTVADINLEQIGRTDDTEGPRVNAVSLTGEDYSDIGKVFEASGKALGTGVQRHPQYSDAFFARSDNQAMADLGVPSSTVCVAFEYPDYHKMGDHWDKVDYPNMAKVDRLVALSLITLANSDKAPEWNAANPKADRYRKIKAERKD